MSEHRRHEPAAESFAPPLRYDADVQQIRHHAGDISDDPGAADPLVAGGELRHDAGAFPRPPHPLLRRSARPIARRQPHAAAFPDQIALEARAAGLRSDGLAAAGVRPGVELSIERPLPARDSGVANFHVGIVENLVSRASIEMLILRQVLKRQTLRKGGQYSTKAGLSHKASFGRPSHGARVGPNLPFFFAGYAFGHRRTLKN
jgi:hypothetical protein